MNNSCFKCQKPITGVGIQIEEQKSLSPSRTSGTLTTEERLKYLGKLESNKLLCKDCY